MRRVRRWAWPTIAALAALALLPGAGRGRHPGRSGPLKEREEALARAAWTYFENNYQPATCLVNAADKYPSATLWDTASYIGGLVSAHQLGLVTQAQADHRLSCLLGSLARLELFRGELPNKVYNTMTLERVDYGNNPGEIGFSAIDLGRLLVWLRIVAERYPQHADAARAVVERWDFCRVVDPCGRLHGARVTGEGATEYVQEGRLGYEEYAAKGFQLWGFDTKDASRAEPYETACIEGVDIPYDARDPRLYGAHNYVVAESYVLDGIEFNWDRAHDTSPDDARHSDTVVMDYAERVYRAQERRFARLGILTARSEHQLAAEPWFVYDTVYSDGYPWNTITEDGRYFPSFAAVSTKAAIGMWALWDTPYTSLLFAAIADAYEPGKGVYEGLYEDGRGVIPAFTANNNGILLEALAYKVDGKLLRFGEGFRPLAPKACPGSGRADCGR